MSARTCHPAKPGSVHEQCLRALLALIRGCSDMISHEEVSHRLGLGRDQLRRRRDSALSLDQWGGEQLALAAALERDCLHRETFGALYAAYVAGDQPQGGDAANLVALQQELSQALWELQGALLKPDDREDFSSAARPVVTCIRDVMRAQEVRRQQRIGRRWHLGGVA
jgi:hypothetical protein